MATYSSSAARRDDFDDDPFPLVDDWKTEEDPSGRWQITPPIVTGGRMAAVKPPGTERPMRQDAQRGTSRKLEMTPAPEQQEASSQDSAPLFRVSFFGPDQQWYSFSANRVGPGGGTGALAPQMSAPQAAAPRLARSVATPEPALHPAWNEPLVRGMDYPVPPVAAPRAVEKEEPEGKDRDFVLQIVQPALTGLMDGSVSTLAPIFATAFATHVTFTVFLIGMASALGAGISMAFSEALSDDGDLTGRGKPILRGVITGLATFLSGAGHTLPFLIPQVQAALVVTYIVVAIELFAIAAIRAKFFGTSWLLSIVQVVGGGALVVATSFLLGTA